MTNLTKRQKEIALVILSSLFFIVTRGLCLLHGVCTRQRGK